MSALRLVDLAPARMRVAKRAILAWYSGEAELRMLRRICPPDVLAVDIGANWGIYTWHLRRLARNVVAFEPQEDMADFLRAAFGASVQVEQVALSEVEGTALLRVPTNRMLDGCATIEEGNALEAMDVAELSVPKRRLDHFALEDVGFIKIDVEGHELAVLRGAVDTISKYRPNLLIEAEERHRLRAVDDLKDFLSEFGYRGFFLNGQHWVPLNQLDPDVGRDALPYNFVFSCSDITTK